MLLFLPLTLSLPGSLNAASNTITTNITAKIQYVYPSGDPGSKEQVNNFSPVVIETDALLFNIVENTTITNPTGKKIPIEKLPVPCKADITYQNINGNNPNVLKIKVLTIYKGSTTKWSPLEDK
jgi:hypothetical protein